jgi:hypothetical protein
MGMRGLNWVDDACRLCRHNRHLVPTARNRARVVRLRRGAAAEGCGREMRRRGRYFTTAIDNTSSQVSPAIGPTVVSCAFAMFSVCSFPAATM